MDSSMGDIIEEKKPFNSYTGCFVDLELFGSIKTEKWSSISTSSRFSINYQVSLS